MRKTKFYLQQMIEILDKEEASEYTRKINKKIFMEYLDEINKIMEMKGFK